ncbi:MAG: glycoside hydrolase family 18 protein [bacterium]
MQKQFIVVTVILILFLNVIPANSQDIITYYPSWRWQQRDQRVNPQTIPYDKISIINYAFFIPLENGTITGMVTEADSVLLKGKMDTLTGKPIPETSLVYQAHQNNVKVMVSIGGWTDSDLFPHIAADAAKRKVFAHSCIHQIKTYGFDGIDIDWEYPGYEPHKGSPLDKENFNLLLQTIRDSLNVLETQTGKQYLLSAALPANPEHVAKIDIKTITHILDFINVMTYDFHGAWDPTANHNTPLYPPAQGDSTLCVDAAFRLYHDHYQVPCSKLNLGMAFYGRAYQGCSQLFKPHQGEEKILFGIQGSDYVQITKHRDLFTRYWDEKAQVPYLISDSLKILVSYDDPESIHLKANYIVENKARGVIIWQIMGDFFEDGSTPLLDETCKVFNQADKTKKELN